MILDTLDNADRYLPLHPAFAPAFHFLRRPDLAELAPGRHAIDGERLFAIVARAPARAREEGQLEVHRRYIDIQYVIAGTDHMGWRALADCTRPSADYDGDKDIRFFTDPPRSWAVTAPGCFCIFFPQDAHLPLVGEGTVHKVVIKVAVEEGAGTGARGCYASATAFSTSWNSFSTTSSSSRS